MDDNIIITGCEDSYIFMEENGNPVVRNSRTMEYEALRMGAEIQPYTLYGDCISLDGAKTKGVFAPKAIHRNATPENVFFDDTRICYFNLYLKQGKKASVEFARTFSDLRYFTRIYFTDEYFVRRKRIVVTIPAALSRFRLVEKNFTPDIRCERSVNKKGDSLFVYTLTNQSALRKESAMPGSSHLYPHLLITGSFADTQEMYAWLNSLANVDCTLPQALPTDITAGCTTEIEKMRRTYAYVQQNIRYVAFESGLASHRPDRPAEVMRKRYGDCKGMALLLRTLLRAQGFDARMAYVGTDDIAYAPDEVPTLATINHAVCLVFNQGKSYCLDATHRYLPLEAVPQELQGRKALVEDGEHCFVLPLPSPETPPFTDSLVYRYRLIADSPALEGIVTRTSAGENKEALLGIYHYTAKEEQNNFLSSLLSGSRHQCKVTDIRTEGDCPEAECFAITAKISNTTAVQAADGALYIEPDPHIDFFDQPIDTARRRHNYLLPWRCRIVREVAIDLPPGCIVSHLPPGCRIETHQGVLSCSYCSETGCIVFRKVMEIQEREIPLALIPAWNDALRRWKKAGEEQIVIGLKEGKELEELKADTLLNGKHLNGKHLNGKHPADYRLNSPKITIS